MNNKFGAKAYPIDDEIDLAHKINKDDLKAFPDDFEDAKKYVEELVKKIYENLKVPESMIAVSSTAQSQSQLYGQGGLHRIYGGARGCGKRLQSLHNNPSFICEVDSVEAEENDNNEHVFDSFRLGSFNSVTFDSFDAIKCNAAVIPDSFIMTPQGITIPDEDPNDQKTINKRNKKNMQDFIRNKYDDRRIK